MIEMDSRHLPNLHATVLIVGDRGVLIRGPSGSGKTTLALALIASTTAAARFSRLVADDQVFVSADGGRLLCHVPPPIAGLVEVRGRVPQPIPHEQAAVVDLVVDLVEASTSPRLAEEASVEIADLRLPVMTLAGRNVEGALAALASRLGLPPF